MRFHISASPLNEFAENNWLRKRATIIPVPRGCMLGKLRAPRQLLAPCPISGCYVPLGLFGEINFLFSLWVDAFLGFIAIVVILVLSWRRNCSSVLLLPLHFVVFFLLFRFVVFLLLPGCFSLLFALPLGVITLVAVSIVFALFVGLLALAGKRCALCWRDYNGLKPASSWGLGASNTFGNVFLWYSLNFSASFTARRFFVDVEPWCYNEMPFKEQFHFTHALYIISMSIVIPHQITASYDFPESFLANRCPKYFYEVAVCWISSSMLSIAKCHQDVKFSLGLFKKKKKKNMFSFQLNIL